MRGESVQLHENDSGASSSGRSPSGVRTPDALAPVVPQHDARRDVVDPVGGPDDGDVRREARDREDVAEIDGRGGDGRDRALPGSADAAHHEEQIHRGHGREEGAEHHVKGRVRGRDHALDAREDPEHGRGEHGGEQHDGQHRNGAEHEAASHEARHLVLPALADQVCSDGTARRAEGVDE